nr:immunoglobulin light chain junction region [Macaca mulatta]MOV74755.1 immunoglobulin light chain junction region [Macaca mulatta]MOV75482.1 immunoglobulin light chain junction region [Macaca mulatta]MOV76436.1 immunoglobulin light chain junction region [Macaca mulatta]MOV76916.1 immunoglobulin light chain junction region [Macaca mulatta]
CQEYLTSPFTF